MHVDNFLCERQRSLIDVSWLGILFYSYELGQPPDRLLFEIESLICYISLSDHCWFSFRIDRNENRSWYQVNLQIVFRPSMSFSCYENVSFCS